MRWILLVLLLIAALQASAERRNGQLEEPTCEVWIDEVYGSSAGNGSVQAPWKDFLAVPDLLASPEPCALIVNVAPGTYHDPKLGSDLERSMHVRRCLQCTGGDNYESLENPVFEFGPAGAAAAFLAFTPFERKIRMVNLTSLTFKALPNVAFYWHLLYVDELALLRLESVSFHGFTSLGYALLRILSSPVAFVAVNATGNTVRVTKHSSEPAGPFLIDIDCNATILDSHFEGNRIEIQGTTNEIGGAAIQVNKASNLTIIASRFVDNVVDFLPEATPLPPYLSGGAIRSLSPTYITSCHFERNRVAPSDPSPLPSFVPSFGGSVAISHDVAFFIHNTTFLNSSASSGGALSHEPISSDPLITMMPHMTPEWRTFSANSSITNSTFQYNSCNDVGCGIYLSPAHPSSIVFRDLIIRDQYQFRDVRNYISGPSIYFSPTFIGGTGLAVYISNNLFSVPYNVSVTLDRVTFINNWNTLRQSIHFNGAAAAFFRIAHVKISNSSVSDHAVGPTTVYARTFYSFVMEDTIITRNRAPLLSNNPERRTAIVSVRSNAVAMASNFNFTENMSNTSCDWASDRACSDIDARNAQNEESLRIEPFAAFSRCRFIDNMAASIFQISGISSAELSDLESSGSMANDRVDQAAFFEVDFVSNYVSLSNIWTHNSSLTNYIAYTPTVYLKDSLFDGRIELQGISYKNLSSPFLQLRTVEAAYISQTSFLNLFSSPLASNSMHKLQIEGCTVKNAVNHMNLRSTPTAVLHSHFENNFSGLDDGGVFNSDSLLAVTNSTFLNNTAVNGGAISVVDSELVLVQSRFVNNSAAIRGGVVSAIASTGASMTHRATFVDCSFEKNAATNGGVYANQGSVTLKLTNSNFTRNLAKTNGGAIWAIGAYLVVADAIFENNFAGFNETQMDTLINNGYDMSAYFYDRLLPVSDSISTIRGDGGAIWNSGVSIFGLTTFRGNIARRRGGAVITDYGELAFERVLFEDNQAGTSGGGAFLHGGNLHNCTFLTNRAAFGGAIEYYSMTSALNFINTTFKENRAEQSGGALFCTAAPGFQPRTDGVTYVDNYAKVAGSCMFVDSPIIGTPPKPCHPRSVNCTISNTQNVTALWGPLYASSHLRFHLTSIRQDISHHMHPTVNGTVLYAETFEASYELRDQYGQRVVQGSSPILTDSTATAETIIPNDIKFLALGGTRSPTVVQIDVLVGERLFQNSTSVSFSPNDFGLGIEANLTVSITSPYNLIKPSDSVKVTIQSCPRGYGLTSVKDSPWYECNACPIGSFNIYGDGPCHSCSISGEASVLSCETSTVKAITGFFVYSNHSNDLFVAQCLPGSCNGSPCSTGRMGLLCSSCDVGYHQSLYTRCDKEICKEASILTVVFGVALVIVLPIIFHALIYSWTLPVLHIILIAQIGSWLLSGALDWAIPIVWPGFASITCGFAMGPLRRFLLVAFAPYLSLLPLPLLYILERVLAVPVSRLHRFHQNGSFFEWRRLTLSLGGLLYIHSSWMLKMSVELLQCQDTPLGSVWTLHPAVSCSSSNHPFVSVRIASLLLAIPLVLIPLGAALVFSVLQWRKSRSFANSVFRRCFESSSPFWHFVEVFGRISLPIAVALTFTLGVTYVSTFVTSMLLVMTLMNTRLNPFTTVTHRLSSSISYAFLCAISIAYSDLYNAPRIVLILTLLVILLVLALLLAFYLGNPAKPDNALASSQWDHLYSSLRVDQSLDLDDSAVQ